MNIDAIVRNLKEQGFSNVYREKRQGKTVVAEFRRFLETSDPTKIKDGLYHFITMRCSYIAHFDLDRFRITYSNPLDLIDGAYDIGDLRRSPRSASAHVYSDGMTSDDVFEEIGKLIVKHEPRLRQEQAQATIDDELATLQRLAAKRGKVVV